jgi:hypothetical protein
MYKSASDLTDNARFAQNLPQLRCLLPARSGSQKKVKSLFTTEAQRAQSFFIVKRACGAINNIKGFSSVLSVPLLCNVFRFSVCRLRLNCSHPVLDIHCQPVQLISCRRLYNVAEKTGFYSGKRIIFLCAKSFYFF